MEKFELNREKMKTVVHYVAGKASDPSVLGSIKLNKVLWYADSVHFVLHGKPITGETYVKRQHGPVPKHMVPIMDELVHEKKVARGKVDFFEYTKNEFISLDDADVSILNAEEMALIDETFERVCMNHTAASVSKETHDIIWDIAKLGEEIPYQAVLASKDGDIDDTDMNWIKSQMSEMGYALEC